jgi:hypothetical protein
VEEAIRAAEDCLAERRGEVEDNIRSGAEHGVHIAPEQTE